MNKALKCSNGKFVHHTVVSQCAVVIRRKGEISHRSELMIE